MTSKQLREWFIEHAEREGVPLARTKRGRVLRQNKQPADTRMAFCDFVERLHRNGAISDRLANTVTL